MRAATTPGLQNENLAREVEEKFNNSGDLYQAIENADGIPYQLVFGKRKGEGYFLNVGDGIRELFGITTEEFTEDLFQRAIIEIIPLNADIPQNQAELNKKIIN